MAEKLFIEYFLLIKLAILLFSLGFLMSGRFGKISEEKLLKTDRILFFSSVVFVFLRVIFLFWGQFKTWQGTYFLPPYQPISYFFQYSWMHFAKQPVFDLGLGIFFFFLIWLGTKISHGRFFYQEEKYSGGLAILMNSWPVNILVFFIVLLTGILFYLAKLVLRKENRDNFLVSFRYFWPAVGLALLLFGDVLVKFLSLGILRV